MAPKRRKRAKKAKQVESLKHRDKRTNIPTEELRDFVAEDEEAPPVVLYPRDPSVDLRTLVSACAPALRDLLQEEDLEARYPLVAHLLGAEEEKAPEYEGIVNAAALQALPSGYRDAGEQAAMAPTLVEGGLFGLVCCGPGRGAA
ncbi:MAG: hypothetical protein KAX19_07035 [Candidatus Brocadiae bacterium]|nr:hypothetical protein [Candidatus Brocadiia bacterium]